MRDALAEELLAKVMRWQPQDISIERPLLQTMATYKWNEYQQFSPGLRFVESLALWLNQFRSAAERQVAYTFVKEQLIFCSSAETNHLVNQAYPDHVRPRLIRQAASEVDITPRRIASITASTEFRALQRQTLILGLSDGARIDVFRRHNKANLSHEQIWQTYELSSARVQSLLKNMRKEVAGIRGADINQNIRFRSVVLLDDFSASGVSYIRRDRDGSLDGKIAKFYQSVVDKNGPVGELIDVEHAQVIVVLYMATERAVRNVQAIGTPMWQEIGVPFSVEAVHLLRPSICITEGSDDPLAELLEGYYDDSIETEDTWKGGTDLKYGFAHCGLPLVLSHNTPNNSLYLLWAGRPSLRLRPLFPRVSRF